MKGYRGFNKSGEEIFYVPQNFILIRKGRSINVDSDVNHLEELTLYFNENPIDKKIVDSVNLPKELLSEFREYCKKNNFLFYKKALEIRDYFCDLIKLNNEMKNRSFCEFAVSKGYGDLIKKK